MGDGPVTYGYQVPYAERLRKEAGVMSMAVGLIVHADQAEAILQEGRADLIALAREISTTRTGRWMRRRSSASKISPACRRRSPTGCRKRASSVKDMVPSTYQQGIAGKP